ncbi:aminotransferase class I and II [Conexibacter sp. JD483]|uniref:HipA family kinase n=1 Tax=unclassified Conexibacter TaxID=2627773 RepID=UPI00271F4A3C|nr:MULTISPECIES: HipA family kinase [unclassified Conexibacter]MDO8188865.1 aminotransferase class I and II [Conexibacter sp. CPCC 205706]MDO8200443.1 aminotransferase class I and II [Conexibacter sp. CPCC 205762]MDR9372598.1 aminotransferase class I and II [Conexibacter sp. JD483]
MRTVAATRYVTPLREGGSLPALVEADDDGLYVVKLRGAGQGPKALAAELIVGELARALALPVPELVYVELDPHLPDAEPDPEIQELLQASAGRNVGLDFLPRALPYNPALEDFPVDPELAAAIVWLDAYSENVDRTPRNPNLMTWHGRLWLIDHGAALYKQHAGLDPQKAGSAFPAIRDHVLLPLAGSIEQADARLAPLVTRELLERLVGLVPPEWLGDGGAQAYVGYLEARLRERRAFVAEAEQARNG